MKHIISPRDAMVEKLIREQWPLSTDDTLAIAKELGVRHPLERGKPKTMTTDFVTTKILGGDVAITQDREVEMVAMNVDIYRRIVTLAKTET